MTSTAMSTFSLAGLTFDQKMIRLAKYLREDVQILPVLEELEKTNFKLCTIQHLDMKDLVMKFSDSSEDSTQRLAVRVLHKIELLEKVESMMSNLGNNAKSRKRTNEAPSAIQALPKKRTAPKIAVSKPRIPLELVQQHRPQIPKSEPAKMKKSMDHQKLLDMLIAKNRQNSEKKKEEAMKRSAKMILTEPLPLAPPAAKKGKY